MHLYEVADWTFENMLLHKLMGHQFSKIKASTLPITVRQQSGETAKVVITAHAASIVVDQPCVCTKHGLRTTG